MTINNLTKLIIKADNNTIHLLELLVEQLENLDNQPLAFDVPDSTS